MRTTILTLSLLAGLSLALQAADVDVSKLPAAASKKGVTFDADIKPIFEKSCFKCHGPDVEKPKGKLRLDTLKNVLKGGDNGPNVVAGDLKKSGLLGAVAHQGDEDDWMPPKNNKAKIAPLTADEVGLIRAWIEQGAK